ncbi:hypothetical protein CCP2SC5_150040 [Azospirillaceae bacterium]
MEQSRNSGSWCLHRIAALPRELCSQNKHILKTGVFGLTPSKKQQIKRVQGLRSWSLGIIRGERKPPLSPQGEHRILPYGKQGGLSLPPYDPERPGTQSLDPFDLLFPLRVNSIIFLARWS